MTKGQKIKFDIAQGVKVLIGLAIIVYGVANMYLSLSAEAIGYNFVKLVIAGFGVYLVVSTFKSGQKINKIFKYLGIASIAIIVISMIVYAVAVILI